MGSSYIATEGLEGIGKTTVRDVTVGTFEQFDIRDMVLIHESGGTQLAEKLRSLILDVGSIGDEATTDKAEVLMSYATRVQLAEIVIKPALAKGAWVTDDRHDLSTQAYQDSGCGIDQSTLATLRNAMLGDFHPDPMIYLDVTPEIGLERTRARDELNHIKQGSFGFSNCTRARYFELAAKDISIHTIDATQPLEAVMADIRHTTIRWAREQGA